jgi:hypothetical protein
MKQMHGLKVRDRLKANEYRPEVEVITNYG